MENLMKTIDVVAFGLLLIGGLNWGLVGIFGFDLVGAIFGRMSFLSRLIYAFVGVAAIYEIAQWKVIQRRWLHAELPAS